MDTKTRKIIEELCTDLQTELDDRYQNRDQYKSLMDKYESEMGVVRRARELIKNSLVQSLKPSIDRYFVFYAIKSNSKQPGMITVDTSNGTFPSTTQLINIVGEPIAITGFNEFKTKADYDAFCIG